MQLLPLGGREHCMTSMDCRGLLSLRCEQAVFVAVRSDMHGRVISVTSATVAADDCQRSQCCVTPHSHVQAQDRMGLSVFGNSVHGSQWLARVSCTLAGRVVEEVVLWQHLMSPGKHHIVPVFCLHAGGVSRRRSK